MDLRTNICDDRQELSMRPVFVLLLGLMMLAAGFVHAAVAQDAVVGVATYIEVMPQSMAAAVTSLRTEAAASRKDDGCQDVRVLREIGRDNRFVVLESWNDQSAFEAHNRVRTRNNFVIGSGRSRPPRPMKGSLRVFGKARLRRHHLRILSWW